jgi:hypothetical protein
VGTAGRGGEHLFDLSDDEGEKSDLRTRQPDRFDQLRQQYLAWNARMLPRLIE